MTLPEFNLYFSQNLNRLRAEARSQLHDPHAAEDVVQQLWLRLLPRHEEIVGTCPDGYVFITLRRLIIDGWRKSDPMCGNALSDVSAPESSNSADSASFAQCEALVRGALADLTDRERQALRLFLSGVCRDDAIAEMGGGYDAALNRARAKMDAHLGQRRTVVVRFGLERLLTLLTDTPGTAPNQT